MAVFPVWAEIDLSAISHNVREIRRVTTPAARVMAVVKADGYGHGAVEVSRTALDAGAEWLGVARTGEGAALRDAGIEARYWCWVHSTRTVQGSSGKASGPGGL